MKRPAEKNKYEQHYYKEVKRKIAPIEDEDEQKKIDKFLQRYSTTPPSTSRESGYSAYLFKGKNVAINPSMVKKQKINKDRYLISRVPEAPKLPVSCLASAEHVVAMQDEVTDFKSESKPATKKKVMYLIPLSCGKRTMSIQKEKKALLELLQKHDGILNADNLQIIYNRKKRILEIMVSTQVADIQLLIRALNSTKRYKIVNCNFEDIHLNEGVCLVKKDASNPIHALVNIADSSSEKGFLERDAGTTSGRTTGTYQDSNWTFNFFPNLKDMRERSGYTQETYAIKIFNGN
ncbi:hypothetical protein [Fluoribacter dumoffii]|uniref:hypothetical protein n=1 Tax=Fluoribacter dumoffii TaxID=463 RepID=UPI00026C776F|nr:hypothetical protein [Fluoribacter dumoffii]